MMFSKRWLYILAATVGAILLLGYVTYANLVGPTARIILAHLIDWIAILFSLAAIASLSRTLPTRLVRMGWMLLGMALLCSLLGDTLYVIQAVGFNKHNPFPSVSDLFYLAIYPLFWIGLLCQPSSKTRTRLGRLGILLEMLIAICGFLTLVWGFSIGPKLQETTQLDSLGKVIAVAYPTLDFATLICILVLFFQSFHPALRLPRAILAVGMLLFTVGDISYALYQYQHTYQMMGWIDSLWMSCYLCVGIAAIFEANAYQMVRKLPQSVFYYPSRLRTVITYLLVFCSAIVLLLSLLRPDSHLSHASVGLLIGTMAVFVLLIFRQFLTVEENRHLYLELQAAYNEASTLAATDPITQLPNYRHLMAHLESEIARADRYGTPMALIFIDLDHFKTINDQHGHWNGDIALRQVGMTLQGMVRSTDMLARYAGEEFVALLPDTTLAQAKALAERMRQRIEALAIPLENGETVAVTISLGLSAYPYPSEDLASLVADADSAMYRVKRHGRNGVGVAREGESLTLPLGGER